MKALPLLCAALLLSFCSRPNGEEPAADPAALQDDTWISIDGRVESVAADQFDLNYGTGTITVEMDDGDRDADAYKLLPGDKVSVTGRIDDDFFETPSIEAASIYVESLGTTFFSSAVDERHHEVLDNAAVPPLVIARTTVRGRVTEVRDGEFMMDTGRRRVRVDVTGLDYDPLDENGYQQVEVGDRVRVVGRVDVSLFEGRRLQADAIVKLYDR